jgi:hypothetical protein
MSAEADRLRPQAERCLQLARETTDEGLAETLKALANESLAKAMDIEQRRAAE